MCLLMSRRNSAALALDIATLNMVKIGKNIQETVFSSSQKQTRQDLALSFSSVMFREVARKKLERRVQFQV